MESACDGCQVGLASLGRWVMLPFLTPGAQAGAAVPTITAQKAQASWHSSEDSPPQPCSSTAQSPACYTNPVITQMRTTRCCLPKAKKQTFETALSSLPSFLAAARLKRRMFYILRLSGSPMSQHSEHSLSFQGKLEAHVRR